MGEADVSQASEKGRCEVIKRKRRVTIADVRKNPKAYASELDAFSRSVALSLAKFEFEYQANIEGIRLLVPGFDGSNRSFCKLVGSLSKHYPSEPMDSWLELPFDELLGYIEAAVEAETDPWVLHWRRMRESKATHKDIATAWKETHPEEKRSIKELTKRSMNEVSRQKSD